MGEVWCITQVLLRQSILMIKNPAPWLLNATLPWRYRQMMARIFTLYHPILSVPMERASL